MQRPTGITILAVLAFIGGVFGILGAFALIAGGAIIGAAGASAVTSAGGGLIAVYGILVLILSVVELVFAVGAWGLKPWAWQLGVILEGFSIVLSIISILVGWSTIGNQIVSVAIAAIIIYYLMTPDIKRAFGRA